MKSRLAKQARVHRKVFSVGNLHDENEGVRYRRRQPPIKRLEALETLRQSAYAYDPATARLQRFLEVTRQWWDGQRHGYECVTSSEVLREAGLGDVEMSRLRLKALAGFLVLSVDEMTRRLARELLVDGILPPVAASDAVHAIVASQHRVNFLLTWNCRHLANPHLLGKLRKFMNSHGLLLPEICTPIELA